MENRFIFADRHGLLCRMAHSHKEAPKSVESSKISVRTNSESDLTTVRSSEGSHTDNALGSSIEYLNLSVPKDHKSDSFFHLFSNDNSNCVHQRKTVTIMEPNGQKFHPVKPIKKEKINDGTKKIMECSLTMKHFLDVSSSGLNVLSRSVSKLNHLTHLYVYSNKIYKLPKEIGNLVNLKELWTQENNLDYLPAELKYCKLLRHLDVRHNHLGDECLVVLKSLTHLEILLLTHNKLSRLDGIGRLKKLENLAVKSNKLEGSITRSVGKLRNLMSLDLSKNRITAIPEEIGNCANMRRLNLEYNNLTHLPNSIGRLEKLDTIGLKYNRLESLPISLSECTLLKELNVENNVIEEFPNSFYNNLHRATKLTISHNYFHNLPAGSTEQYKKTEKINAEYNSITKLGGVLVDANQLKVLNLACNNLTELTSVDIYNLRNLVELNVAFNHLMELPKDISRLENLENLDITNNNLKSFPCEIGDLKKLKILNMESNCVADLPIEFGNLEKLKDLNISSNQIKNLPVAIVRLKNLEMLNISENFLDELPDNINHLMRLTHLFLKDNKFLNSLPVSLVSMKALSFLSLSGCPLRDIPSEYTKSPVAVMAYLRALEIGLRLKEYLQISDENRRDRTFMDLGLTNEEQAKLIKQPKMSPPTSTSSPLVSTTPVPTLSTSSSDPITTHPIANGATASDNSEEEYIPDSSNEVIPDSKETTENDPDKTVDEDLDDELRPRSNSASAASKKNLLLKLQTNNNPKVGKLQIPEQLMKKMKTTEAGFLACSK